MADHGAPKQNEPFFYHNLTSSRARERDFGRAGREQSRGQKIRSGWSLQPPEFHEGLNFLWSESGTKKRIGERRNLGVRVNVWGVRGWVTEHGQMFVEESAEEEAGDRIIPAGNSAGCG